MGLGHLLKNYAEGEAEHVFGEAVDEGGKIEGHIKNAINDVKGCWDEGVCQEEHEHGEDCCPPCGHTQIDQNCEVCTEYESSWTGGGGSTLTQPSCGHSDYDEDCDTCTEHVQTHWDQSGPNAPTCGHEAPEEGCDQCDQLKGQCWGGGADESACGHQQYDESCEECNASWQ
ncbi:hypothetical protein GLAREA_11952 [Glarea lozoyensis ATCC 20868]|uniref:Uncharacterized protein n=1 Tax=Glarea lozoyensis (strain ATCC 20868 / MF5171) TaxID=1116229 RepID=S3D243_GLAL2|nr:uncharacterized protein GLAREA_11952 [Glarea lozoyensis ATCC 20868]EPE31870.1 hypothetical protein GLAREA_11952 [Glarea lozoyensis ATCC 20868]